MANEFARIDLVCDGAFITPRNIGSISKYPLALGANQVCTLAGALPGSNIVSGRDYIRAAFDYDSTRKFHFPFVRIRLDQFFRRRLEELRIPRHLLHRLQSHASLGCRESRE